MFLQNTSTPQHHPSQLKEPNIFNVLIEKLNYKIEKYIDSI